LRLDSRLELVLGDRLNVRALGLIGRLTGKVMFINRPGADLLPVADGRLSIEDGTFRAFGQDLEIETGRVVYASKPVTEPELNVRAVRWIDNDPVVSSVGVLLSGPADQPLLELFSRPELDQTEIQSYLLTGSGSSNRDSVLSIGTYLYPKLYVSYGYNLLEETNQFDTLYTITPRYGVEAKVGEADNTLNMTITYEH
jgi:autotransporter translocation and assembly factor TamB